ncbi:hypothetical protein TWF694_000254 [Orbilia ellipsospora]|uniref:Ankyrin n=1 Tax=Orbilia ellipsospora TaxID=2528407 RepID=A0AAV9XNF0_9PEZI
MTSVVIDHLETQYLNNSKVGIAYIYFNYKRAEEQSIDKLLLNLLKQLSQRQDSVPSCVTELYMKHVRNRTRPSRREITSSLSAVAALYSRIFIVVDAIDECQSGDCRSTFLNELFQLRDLNANIFATSRPIFDIETDFKNANSIILEIKASDEDVKRYLEGKIDASGVTVLKRNRGAIITKISEVASGMFLLAHLLFESIRDERRFGVINRILENAAAGPAAYDYAYENAMIRIRDTNDGDSRNLALRIISWITCASRPLKTAELLHALAIEVEGPKDAENELDEANILEINDVVSLCTGLVKAGEETDVVRLVHYTTQEYFDRTWHQWFPDAHRDIAISCVTYMSYNTFKSGPCLGYYPLEKRRMSKPLYEYAVENWAHHTHIASKGSESSLEREPLVLKFLQNDNLRMSCVQVRLWREDLDGVWFYPERMPAIPFVVYEGLLSLVVPLLEMGADIEAQDWQGRTALIWAAENGYEATTKFLVDKGADTEVKDRYFDRAPLSWAAENGHEAVVRCLVESGSNMETMCRRGRTALLWAARNDQDAIVRLLVGMGADIKVKDKFGETALILAAQNGSEAAVRVLEELMSNLSLPQYY